MVELGGKIQIHVFCFVKDYSLFSLSLIFFIKEGNFTLSLLLNCVQSYLVE